MGRADLLLMLEAIGEGGSAVLADLARFEWRPPAGEPDVAKDVGTPVRDMPDDPVQPASEAPIAGPLNARLVLVTKDADSEPAAPEAMEAASFDVSGPTFDHRLLSAQSGAEQVPGRLIPPRRLEAVIRQALRYPQTTRDVDVRRWIDGLAAGEPPSRLPRRMRRTWGSGAAVVWPITSATRPYSSDYRDVCALVHRRSGGLTPIWLRSAEGTWYRYDATLSRSATAVSPWRKIGPACPELGHNVFVLAAAEIPSRAAMKPLELRRWRAVEQMAVLQPAGRPASTVFGRRFDAVYEWGSAARMRSSRGKGASLNGTLAIQTQSLLAALVLTVHCEPALLRALRTCLGLPSAVEGEVWCHEHVAPSAVGIALLPNHRSEYRRKCLSMPAGLIASLAEQVRVHHTHLSPLVRLEELGIAGSILSETLPPSCEVASSHEDWMMAARTIFQNPDSPEARAIARYVVRASSRAARGDWSAVPGLAETFTLACAEDLRAGTPCPPEMPLDVLQRCLALLDHGAIERGSGDWFLVQHGEGLLLQRVPPGRGDSLLTLLGPLPPGATVVIDRSSIREWIPLVADHIELARPDAGVVWGLSFGHRHLALEELARPRWAEEWGRDMRSTFAITRNPAGSRVRLEAVAGSSGLRWIEAVRAVAAVTGPLGASPAFEGDGPSAARQATFLLHSWAHDELFAYMRLGSVEQRFRWIEPGEFWMGSPDDEPGRYDREGPRHRVRITRGFWLADTACTQALWLAVMGGKNPSNFRGDPNLPVERVNWDDVQQFLKKLQSMLPQGCEATLPSEAEWEYACRAGTDAAFNLGPSITTQQVNFSGKLHYDDDKPSLGGPRETTVPVKDFDPNPWGLYQMHGNVWEWCSDGMRDYAKTASADAIEDPQGPAEQGPEALRAVRGGSWLFDAGDARSACRYAREPGFRVDLLGFRLALRSSNSSPAPAGRVAPEAPRGIAPGRDGTGPAPRRDAGAPSSDLPSKQSRSLIDRLLGRKK